VRYLVVGAKSETFAQHPRNNDICYKEHFGERGKLVRYLVVGAKSETFAQHPRNNDICYKEHFGERGHSHSILETTIFVIKNTSESG
jgi:hypothetical protein